MKAKGRKTCVLIAWFEVKDVSIVQCDRQEVLKASKTVVQFKQPQQQGNPSPIGFV